MKQKEQGFTVIELVISVAITMLVVATLFQLLVTIKNVYTTSGVKTELLNKQALMSRNMNQDFFHKKVKVATKCGADCISFTYEDGETKQLVINREQNLFQFGVYATNLVSGSQFGSIDIHTETVAGVPFGKNDSIIEIHIPITHKLLSEDFGIHLVYQYDSRTTSISDIQLNSKPTTDTIYLKGATSMTQLASVPFTEPGYYIYNENNQVVENATNVTVEGTVGNEVGKTYTLTYILRRNGSVITTAERKVTVVKNVYAYDYTGNVQIFTAPTTGTYQVELWGAQGNMSSENRMQGGKGAYTKGQIHLKKGDIFYVYVGQHRKDHEASFNAGSIGGSVPRDAASGTANGYGGGGATDIRLVSGQWNQFDSLKSRIMVAAGGGGATDNVTPIMGGYGGALTGGNGFNGKSSDYAGEVTVPPTGATQTGGGTSSIRSGNLLDLEGGDGHPGTFGIAGNANEYWGSGGGGGYYGGAGGGYIIHSVDSGAGGSSFISGYNGCDSIAKVSSETSTVHTGQSVHYSGLSFEKATMIAGNAAMPNPRGTGDITGNVGNGYAKITLISF